MKRLILTSTILTASGLTAAPGVAQQTYDLGTIVLSSSLSPVELGRTGATVEVLEGEEAGANDTAVIDRLDRLPGVSSTANGGMGGVSKIRIRGLPGQYVGARINGIDVGNPSNPQTFLDFGGLTASGVQRVEVLKGSQSALYGSEAIAGVVNITTFTPEKLGFSGQASVEAGSFDTYSGSLSAGYKSERGHVALSYGRIVTDGISAQSFNTEKDGFRQTTVDLTAEYDATETVTVGGALHYRDGKLEIDRFPPDATGENYTTERGARVFATISTGPVEHTFSYSHYDFDRDDPQGRTQKFTGERRTFEYLGSADLGAGTVLSFGAEHVETEFTNDSVSGDEDNTAIKAELLISPTDRIDLSAALRYDDNSTFGGKTTGRLAAVWRPVEDLAFRAVVGTGYRAPSLYERYDPVGGDPDLTPENSISYELGVEKTLAGGFVKATVFYTEIDDLIMYDWASATPCGCYRQMPGTSKSKGIEFSGEYALTSRINLFGNYTYTNSRKQDGTRREYIPRHDLVVGVDAAITDRLSTYFDVRRVADVVPASPADTKVGDHTLVGAGASYDVTDAAELYLRVENLFDEDYETVGGYNQPGRAAYVGLRASF